MPHFSCATPLQIAMLRMEDMEATVRYAPLTHPTNRGILPATSYSLPYSLLDKMKISRPKTLAIALKNIFLVVEPGACTH